MRHDRQAALLVDLGDRRLEALVAPEPSLQEDAEEVPAAGRHLLGHDDLDAAAALPSEALAFDRGLDPLVVGDGDQIQIRLVLGIVEDLGGRSGPVRGDRVDVHVGFTEALAPRRSFWRALGRSVGRLHAASPVSVFGARSRSGQIG